MKLYNTLTRKIEEFKPVNPPKVGMYTCGMTVYDHTHIGHMRTYVNTDVLRRVLEYNGFEVTQVENVTDVGHLFGDRDMGEDKLEVTATRAKKSAWEIAKMYEKEFFETMEALNVKRPTIVCRATEHIKEMIELVKRIEKKGFTYKTSDGIYFDTSKIKDYNQLSGMPLEKLKEGARVEPNPEKRNPTDFALWKFSPKNVKRQMEWDSPWGVGFPGWHIECSAMGIKYLGEKIDSFGKLRVNGEHCRTIDIHTGGEDHIPIHHTNERAQNIAATGAPVVNLWFHNAFLMVEGKKMSKSLKNFYWMRDVKERGFNPLALRYLFLTAHYRAKMNFTWKSLEGAANALEKLKDAVRELNREMETQKHRTPRRSRRHGDTEEYREKFKKVINNDLAMPEALAVVWELAKSNIPNPDKLDLVLDFDQVLGLRLAEVKEIKIPAEVKKLVEEREKLRKMRKWKESDKFRKMVEKLGYLIEDTPQGAKVKKKLAGQHAPGRLKIC